MTTMYDLAAKEYRPPKDLPELKTYLQAAVEIEHLTIPVYMSGLYSVVPGTNAYACEVIRSVLLEEMLHMTLAGNLLNAVGGTPDMGKLTPGYPARLPFGDASLPPIALQHFSPDALETFLLIERPHSFVPSNPDETGWTSIGQFYEAIRRGIVALEEAARGTGQTIFTGDPAEQVGPEDFYNSGGETFRITDLKSALLAIEVISEQGEGAQDSIWDSDDKIFGEQRQVAHYFRFNEIVTGRSYGPHDLPRTQPSGPLIDVTWQDAYPIDPGAKSAHFAPYPEIHRAVEDFNDTYARLLVLFERVFDGKPREMEKAVPLMLELRDLAQRIYRNPHPDTADKPGLHASPTFELDDSRLRRAREHITELLAAPPEIPAQTATGPAGAQKEEQHS